MKQLATMVKSRPFLVLEFLCLCLLLPGWIIYSRSAPFMFTFLWAATLYCFVIYRFFYFTSWDEIWNIKALRWKHLAPVLLRWALASLAMVIFLWFYNPERLFVLPRERPEMLIWLLLLYPLISALPQEFIFCSFFFKRYGAFFGVGGRMIMASAVIFAFAHILYINPVAPVLSLLGGLIFAWDFARHKSLALVAIEHGLYGNSLFVIGLGWYFYSGNVVLTP